MAIRDVGGLIKSIDEKLKAKADADMRSYHLTMVQSFVLTYLHDHGGQATQKEIETHLDVSHPAVVGIISRMEQNGHLVTWFDPQNKRNKIVRLTPAAEALGDSINQRRVQWEQAMLKGFEPEETKLFMQMLQRLYDNIQ